MISCQSVRATCLQRLQLDDLALGLEVELQRGRNVLNTRPTVLAVVQVLGPVAAEEAQRKQVPRVALHQPGGGTSRGQYVYARKGLSAILNHCEKSRAQVPGGSKAERRKGTVGLTPLMETQKGS